MNQLELVNLTYREAKCVILWLLVTRIEFLFVCRHKTRSLAAEYRPRVSIRVTKIRLEAPPPMVGGVVVV